MDSSEIRTKIKNSIASIANLSPDEIADHASYKEDLMLDSLTILEIVVDVEFQFQIKVPDEQLSAIRTVQDTVEVVQQYLYVQTT